MLSLPDDAALNLIDAAPDAMIVVDADGIVQFVNRRVTVLFGYKREELIGAAVESLVPERFRQRHQEHRGEYMTHLRTRPMGRGLELYGLRSDGTEFPVEISLGPIDGGGRILVAAAIRDATHRKDIERKLIAAQTAAERARDEADSASQAKSKFLATASHDLRQPLQTISLLNGALRRSVCDDDAAEALSQQERAIGAMSRLLNALLDISKLESGAVKPDPTDFAVAALFEELRREFASIAVDKGLRLDIEPSRACVHSDRPLVEQILRNLVANAIKYTRDGRVAISCQSVPDSRMRIEVRDTGVGIPAEHLSRIYDEFYQVDVAPNRSRDGYGLGLSIVRRIVHLLGLELDVRSQVGCGSSFSVLLPPALTPVAGDSFGAAVRMAPMTYPVRGGAVRVILVEDDRGVRDATRMLLRSEGYQVTAVSSLQAALEAARDGVDLLVTDYHLSDSETGTQVIEALRDTLSSHLKAVLITGDTSSAIKELPRDPYLRIANKPINAEIMLSMMRELIAGDCPLPS